MTIYKAVVNTIYRAKNLCRYLLISIVFYANSVFRRNPHVCSIDETIEKIVMDKASIVRFGDGEIDIISGKSINFQTYDENLKNRLIEIIQSNYKGLMIGIPPVFENIKIYNSFAKRVWKENLFNNRKIWLKYCNLNNIYYNSFISRLYMDYKDKSKCKDWFTRIKKVWDGREIVIIEGQESRLGVNNDLFDKAKDIKRILCPSNNSFGKYNEILSYASKFNKIQLILIALGPTAKVLAYDLFIKGYQVLDIGHIDVEYEWFLKNAKSKIPLEYKYVNEAGSNQGDILQCTDKNYLEQIVIKII